MPLISVLHIFSGILIRKDHPSHINILSAFHNFIAEHTQE
jgi:hypothetical protein